MMIAQWQLPRDLEQLIEYGPKNNQYFYCRAIPNGDWWFMGNILKEMFIFRGRMPSIYQTYKIVDVEILC